jgi:hypothetical protein
MSTATRFNTAFVNVSSSNTAIKRQLQSAQPTATGFFINFQQTSQVVHSSIQFCLKIALFAQFCSFQQT